MLRSAILIHPFVLICFYLLTGVMLKILHHESCKHRRDIFIFYLLDRAWRIVCSRFEGIFVSWCDGAAALLPLSLISDDDETFFPLLCVVL